MRKKRQLKGLLLSDDDAIYAEALRRIGGCREKGKRKLDLSDLSLKAVPPEIAGLETLTELDITGTSLKEIPDYIGHLRSLRRLSVGSPRANNENRGIVLPPALSNLTALQNIHLGHGVSAPPEWMWDMRNLRALSICNDRIETVSAGIGRLTNLQKLRVYGENISVLPDEIGRLPLSVLDLQCPRLTTLPASFSSLKKMKTLAIRHCNFPAIPGFICGWTELERLILYMYNTFQGPPTKLTKIPKNIGDLKKLRVLDLESTCIAELPESLCECPLECLIISGDLKKLPENFGKLSGLKKLDLSAYKLQRLSQSFGGLSSLEEFTFLGGSLEELPESAGNLSSLKALTITTGGNLRLPESFGRLSALETLCIDAEKMKTLPETIGKCGALKRLYIESDGITGLPESFTGLKALEEFHAETFNLKKLPADFGDLGALKSLDIFSGALAAFPESMGKLKNLKSLYLDAHNVVDLPDSFRELSCVKQKYIIAGGRERKIVCPSPVKKAGTATVDFDDLTHMSGRYRQKILDACSLKELENLLRRIPHRRLAGEAGEETIRDILLRRKILLNRKFKWIPENIRRIVTVSDEFLAAWETGFAKAKSIIDVLYEKEPDKEAFWNNYDVEITLDPQILTENTEDDKFEYPYDTVYSVLVDHLAAGELNISIGENDYNPVTKDESGFREGIHVSRELSWNIEGFGDIDLADQYICYAMYILYSHHEWANEDILRINSIDSRVTITRLSNGGIF
jgi:Leucine-rich repeat (LRR) protein